QLGNGDHAGPVQEQIAVEASKLSDKGEAFKGHSWLAAKGSEKNANEAVLALGKYKDPEPCKALQTALDSSFSSVRLNAAEQLALLKEDDRLGAMAKAAQAYPDDGEAIESQMVALLVAAESLSDLEDRTKK